MARFAAGGWRWRTIWAALSPGRLLRRPADSASLGRRGEEAAARYVRRLGYRIVARADRSPFGEIDLIAVDGRTVVFLEVKTRESHERGHPSEAVDRTKQQRMTRAALAYLKSHRLLEGEARFDVIAVTWPPGARRPTIEHVRNAFDAVGNRSMFS